MTDRKIRILGKMMSQYIGKNVIVAGHLTKVSANGDCIEITTFDDVKVNANLSSPLSVAAEGLVEVAGIVKSKGTIEASQCVHFDEEHSKDFDLKAYNDIIIILQASHDGKWKLNDNMSL